jgi:hypothetical protein
MFDGAREQAFRRVNNRPGQGGFGQDGYTQGGGSSQDGYTQGGGSSQGGFSQGGFSQGGSSQGGSSQGGAPGQSWNNADDDDYDHYNVEGANPGQGRNQSFNNRGSRDFGFGVDNLADDIGGAVLGAAFGFAGRAIGKRMKKAFEEKVIPAMEARMAQAQQQSGQSKAAEAAIVERYPELRGCLKDQVVFLDGGYRTVPVSELKMPITVEQADAVVARLR